MDFATATANAVMHLFAFISAERQRVMENEKLEVLNVLEELKAKRYPFWSTVRLIKHRKKLQNFVLVFMGHLKDELQAREKK
jgi:uncharacterized protein YbgA (DUF1722 family)